MIFDIFDFFDNTKSYSEAISSNSFFKLRKSTSHRFATTEPLNATWHESSKILKNTPPPISFINQKIREKETYSRVETIFQNYFPLRYTHREKNSLGSLSSESKSSIRSYRSDYESPPPLDPSRLARRNANDSGIPRKEKVVSGWRWTGNSICQLLVFSTPSSLLPCTLTTAHHSLVDASTSCIHVIWPRSRGLSEVWHEGRKGGEGGEGWWRWRRRWSKKEKVEEGGFFGSGQTKYNSESYKEGSRGDEGSPTISLSLSPPLPVPAPLADLPQDGGEGGRGEVYPLEAWMDYEEPCSFIRSLPA